jgi:hypothetical protein
MDSMSEGASGQGEKSQHCGSVRSTRPKASISVVWIETEAGRLASVRGNVNSWKFVDQVDGWAAI